MGAIRGIAAAMLMFVAAVASAQDCVTEGRVLSTRGSSPNLVNGPIAWSGSVLGLAKTQEGLSGALWFATYDGSLNQLTADRLIASDARAIIATAWTGEEFGVIFRTLNQTLKLQRLTSGGEPIGAPVLITPTRTVYVADEIDAVWNNALDAYVVARAISTGRDEGLWFTVLEQDGTQRSDAKAPVNLTQQSELDLTVSDSGVIGAFFINFNGSLAFARAEPGAIISVRSLGLTGTDIEAAAHGNLFVVTRMVPNTFDEGTIRWFVVDSAAQFVRQDALFISPEGDDVVPLGLISTGDELALTYAAVARRDQPFDHTYRLRRFTIDGTVLSDTDFSASSSSQARAITEFPIVWTGTSYLSAPVRESSDRLNSFLLRYCPLRAEIVSPSRRVFVGQTVTFSAVASGGVPVYTYSWVFPNEIGPKTGQSLDREFNRTGTYTVTLTVTDFAGSQVTREIEIDVVVETRKTRAVRRH